MTRPSSSARRFLAAQLAVFALMLSMPSASLVAQSFGERRAHVGLKLFRTLLAADTGIHERAGSDGDLLVTFLHVDDSREAANHARELADHLDAIRGRSIRVEVASLEKVLGEESYRPAALFVSQRLATDEIRRLVDYAVRRHVIVFSPFEGDVERGILGGISVEATVRPLINMQTLSASGLAIKAFYLKVAKRYGGAQP
ncbi:MAG: hypothetical protein KDH20_17500 [Rhodocyclaceae bacterium]|nr:hypothetical protein [Rhodocyclaceae bacterium]